MIMDNTPPLSRADWHEVGARLREAREYLGLSFGFVSMCLGISEEDLSSMESGTKVADAEAVARFARFYRCSPTWLMGEEADDEVGVLPDGLLQALDRPGLTDLDRAEVLRFARFLQHAGPAPQTQEG